MRNRQLRRSVLALAALAVFAVTAPGPNTPAAAAEPTTASSVGAANGSKPVYHGDRQSPLIALTFDDAPHPTHVPRLLSLLREQNVKATFFLVGEQLRLFPEVARAIVADQHEVGNHSLGHRNLPRAAPTAAEEEIVGMQQLIKEHLGVQPVLYRPAYGVVSDAVRRICEREHLTIVLWDLDTSDWRKESTRQTIARTVLDKVSSGSIVLFHATQQKTVEAVGDLIPVLRRRGYEFATVSQLLDDQAIREQIRRLAPQPGTVRASGKTAQGSGEKDDGEKAPTPRPIRAPALPSP